MFTMNTIVVKESDLEINAYLNSLSLHQSFEEDDSEDDEFYTTNPSGSVLQPTTNPYNKQRKIAEANETLFAEEVSPKSPQKVKFNKVEKRICYDYFGSSFESDSIKSYEDEESEESLLQSNAKQKNEQPSLDVKGTHLQPRTPASKVVVTVTPKTEEDQANSESESEDVCVGTITKPQENEKPEKDSSEALSNDLVVYEPNNEDSTRKEEKPTQINVEERATPVKETKPDNTHRNSKQSKTQDLQKTNHIAAKKVENSNNVVAKKIENTNKVITKKIDNNSNVVAKKIDNSSNVEAKKIDNSSNVVAKKIENTNHVVTNKVDNSNIAVAKRVEKPNKDKTEELVFLDLEKPSTKSSDSLNECSDFYPCLANHSGITIRITGADSIESVESESTDDEVQIEENYISNLYNIVEFRPDNKTFVSKTYQNSRSKEATYQFSNETFILKGTKSTQNVRSPRASQKLDTESVLRSHSKNEDSKKELALSKPKPEKTEHTVPHRAHKDSIKVATKPKQLSFKSKQLEEDSNRKTEECCCTKKVRPKSCVEKESAKVRTSSRPLTAPVKRSCCQWGQPHLPEYNGLRSEYGLSAEQLMERKRHKMEALKMQKQRKEQKCKEEQDKRKENEAKFIAWLEDKRKQAQLQFLRNQKIKAESGIKLYPAPTGHLKRTGAVRSRRMFKSQRKCVSLEELLNNASSHEKKTYKIYLGLSFE